MTEISLLIPEHSRPLRLKQVVRNIRETSRFHHEIIVVGDRLDMGVMWDYDPETVDKKLIEYLRINKLGSPPFPSGDYTVDDCAKYCAKWEYKLFTFRSWMELEADYLKKYDVTVKECPLDYKIKDRFFERHTFMPSAKTLRDLKEWDFGADVVMNWAMEEDITENDMVMVMDDDMIFLKDWDCELFKCVEEDDDVYDTVYVPKVYNVRGMDESERSELPFIFKDSRLMLGPFEVQLRDRTFLDISFIERLANVANKDKPIFNVEDCGDRIHGAPLPMLLHKRLWNRVGGRDYLVSPDNDGTAPGRFIGGTEVHFDDKLGDNGVKKKVCWRSIVCHSKIPLMP